MDNIQFSNSFSFNSYSFKQSKHTDNSCGTHAHHIGVVKSGSAVFDVGGRIFTFKEGDIFYTPLGCKYHSYWSGEKIIYDSYAFQNFITKDNLEYGIQKINASENAKAALAALEQNRKISTKSIGLFYLFLGELLPDMIPSERDLRREQFTAAINFMRDNISFSARDLARHLRISESGMYALFSEYGTTPVLEKHKIRAEQARALLLTTDMTVEEISGMLGFSSPAYFRKVFFKAFNKTPRETRKISTKSL